MAPKRKYDALTGGTGDVCPQLMHTAQLVQTSADAETFLDIKLPVTRLMEEYCVFEVLKVFFMANMIHVPFSDIIPVGWLKCVLGVGILDTCEFSNTRIFAAFTQNIRRHYVEVIGENRFTDYIDQQPFVLDLTDGAGHGVLVATDAITMGIASYATNVANFVTCKILYRVHAVGVKEYIGIVSGQN